MYLRLLTCFVDGFSWDNFLDLHRSLYVTKARLPQRSTTTTVHLMAIPDRMSIHLFLPHVATVMDQIRNVITGSVARQSNWHLSWVH
jgi:hypothetical protein